MSQNRLINEFSISQSPSFIRHAYIFASQCSLVKIKTQENSVVAQLMSNVNFSQLVFEYIYKALLDENLYNIYIVSDLNTDLSNPLKLNKKFKIEFTLNSKLVSLNVNESRYIKVKNPYDSKYMHVIKHASYLMDKGVKGVDQLLQISRFTILKMEFSGLLKKTISSLNPAQWIQRKKDIQALNVIPRNDEVTILDKDSSIEVVEVNGVAQENAYRNIQDYFLGVVSIPREIYDSKSESVKFTSGTNSPFNIKVDYLLENCIRPLIDELCLKIYGKIANFEFLPPVELSEIDKLTIEEKRVKILKELSTLEIEDNEIKKSIEEKIKEILKTKIV